MTGLLVPSCALPFKPCPGGFNGSKADLGGDGRQREERQSAASVTRLPFG